MAQQSDPWAVVSTAPDTQANTPAAKAAPADPWAVVSTSPDTQATNTGQQSSAPKGPEQYPLGEMPGDRGIVAGLERIPGAITGIYHALTDPATEEEKAAIQKKVDEANKYMPVKFSSDWAQNPSPATLAYHRILDAPMEQLAAKSQKETDVAKDLLEHHEYWKGGNQYLSGLMDKILSKDPTGLGVAANSIAERVERGDPGAAVDIASLIAMEHAPEAMKAGGQAASDAVDAIRSGVDNLRPSRDEAAQIALNPAKKKAIMAQKDLTGARPYYEGATNLTEAQQAAKVGKAEVWTPYSQAVQIMDPVPVKGPDGAMTTVGDLEKQRLQVSAELNKARRLQPTDYQTQVQKDGVIKELSDKYTRITDKLDPELEKTGIDPKLIRTTHGQIQGLYKLLEGRNTLTETAQKYGLSKMLNVDITHPLQNFTNVAEGAKDIVTGRPLFSGKPTDVAIKEGFREPVAGPTAKPNLVPGRSNGIPSAPPIKGLLGSGPLPVPAVADTSGIVRGYQPEIQPLAENRQLPAAPAVQPPTRQLSPADVIPAATEPYGQPPTPLITPDTNERPLNVPRATPTPREVAIVPSKDLKEASPELARRAAPYENIIHSEDHTPAEKAAAYKAVADLHKEADKIISQKEKIAADKAKGGATKPKAAAKAPVATQAAPVAKTATEAGSGALASADVDNLADVLVDKGNDPSFAQKRAQQLVDAVSGKPGYNGIERRVAETLLDKYVGAERRREITSAGQAALSGK